MKNFNSLERFCLRGENTDWGRTSDWWKCCGVDGDLDGEAQEAREAGEVGEVGNDRCIRSDHAGNSLLSKKYGCKF